MSNRVPEGWIESELGQLIEEIGDGGTPSTSDPKNFGGGIPWVVIDDIRPKIYKTQTTISEQGLQKSSAKLWGRETVILSTGATIGRVGIAKTQLATKQGICGIVTTDKLDSSYLYQYLLSITVKLNALSQGSTIKETRPPTIKKIRLNLPPPPEQKKIAEILSTVDQAIEQTEAMIAKQQRIRTALIQDFLMCGIDKNGNLRSECTHKFKDSPLGAIPVEWHCGSLSYFVPSTEYGISTSLGESGQPVLRMNNLCEGEVKVDDLKYTNLPVPEHLWLRPGDVLFNRTNSWEHVGRTGVWRGQCERATFASYLVRLNPDSTLLLPELLNIWLNWGKPQISMRRFATPGVQQVNINPTNLRMLPAAFPANLDEQAVIVDRIRRQSNAVSLTRDALNKLRRLKTGLMQDLLTAKVSVTSLLTGSESKS